ncbi:MAG TPA: DUF3426 domain-containing protein [Thiobacillaceae bacterium]|nr:DUF3426 domain-containing protein [Thiobacillaceae bacterium]HNU63933.1 DUF3426 domain-containing protein [Thiobacillaceae bacterium]
MRTTCPECGTVFRVHQEQLGLRRGLVRCGHCGAVFNAYDTLRPELEGAPPESETAGEDVSAPAAPPAEEGARHASDHALDVQPTGPVVAVASFPPGVADAGGELPEDTAGKATGGSSQEAPGGVSGPDGAAAAGHLQADAVRDEMPVGHADIPVQDVPAASPENPLAESSEAILLSELPHRLSHSAARLPAWQRSLYILLILSLLTGLVGQLAYFLRAELAAALPGARPPLERLCRVLDCTVPLPRQLTPQAIVSSSLEHDPEQVSRVRLSFLLTNRTRQVQAWPHVVLTLSDVRESPVARKVFPPEAYLPPGTGVRAGFPAQSEQEVRVDLDIGSLAAASYVIGLVYP